jgi:transposase-like protein
MGQAGGSISRTAVSGICRELRERYRAFRARSLGEVRLLALFMDAIYLVGIGNPDSIMRRGRGTRG